MAAAFQALPGILHGLGRKTPLPRRRFGSDIYERALDADTFACAGIHRHPRRPAFSDAIDRRSGIRGEDRNAIGQRHADKGIFYRDGGADIGRDALPEYALVVVGCSTCSIRGEAKNDFNDFFVA